MGAFHVTLARGTQVCASQESYVQNPPPLSGSSEMPQRQKSGRVAIMSGERRLKLLHVPSAKSRTRQVHSSGGVEDPSVIVGPTVVGGVCSALSGIMPVCGDVNPAWPHHIRRLSFLVHLRGNCSFYWLWR